MTVHNAVDMIFSESDVKLLQENLGKEMFKLMFSNRNFGSTTKSELEMAAFKILYDSVKDKNIKQLDYRLSILLGITERKVQNLKSRCHFRFENPISDVGVVGNITDYKDILKIDLDVTNEIVYLQIYSSDVVVFNRLFNELSELNMLPQKYPEITMLKVPFDKAYSYFIVGENKEIPETFEEELDELKRQNTKEGIKKKSQKLIKLFLTSLWGA